MGTSQPSQPDEASSTVDPFGYALTKEQEAREAARTLRLSVFVAVCSLGLGLLLLRLAADSLERPFWADVAITLGHSFLSATLAIAALTAWYGYRRRTPSAVRRDLEDQMRILAALGQATVEENERRLREAMKRYRPEATDQADGEDTSG